MPELGGEGEGLGGGGRRRQPRGLSNACGEPAGPRPAAAPGPLPAGSPRRRRGCAAGPRRPRGSVCAGRGGWPRDPASERRC